LSVMEQRYRDGDQAFKPNTRTYTSVIDAWAKSGEKGAARRAEQILNNMIAQFDATGDVDVKPNVHTSNAVCNVSFLDHLLIVCSITSTLTLFFIPGLCVFEIRRRSRRGTADCLSSL
jgi:hypothetical protein